MDGRVIDYETNEPISDAHVIATWGGHAGYDTSVCVHLAATKTDADGYYRFPRQRMDNPYVSRSDMRVSITLYKYGYKRPRVLGEYLQKDDATGEERINALLHVAGLSDCGNKGDEPQLELVPLHKGLYMEADEIATSRKELILKERLLYHLEINKVGYEEAEQRHLIRLRGKR